jgi:enoyl-CoA hydratase
MHPARRSDSDGAEVNQSATTRGALGSVLRVEHPFDGCAMLVLNRPQARNALSRELRRALVAAIDALATDPAVRVLVLTGQGDAFCAGLDLKELGTANEAQRIELLGSAALDPIAALERFCGPVIGAINGPAVTGGFELALACDVLIASPAASFADSHARVGVLPGWGLSQKLSRAVGIYRAREVCLAGTTLGAEKALQWGLVNRVVDAANLLAEAFALARDMLRAAPNMLVQYKRLINEGHGLTLDAALELEKTVGAQQHPTFRAPGIDSRGGGTEARNPRGNQESKT